MFFGTLACMSLAHAELYKWTDSQGKVHYTDQPPTVNAQSIKPAQSGQAEATTQATKSLNDRDQAYKKRMDESEQARLKAEKEAEQARVQRENCDKARNNLKSLQSSSRVYSTNSAGQRTYMNEAERADALANTQKAVSDFCK